MKRVLAVLAASGLLLLAGCGSSGSGAGAAPPATSAAPPSESPATSAAPQSEAPPTSSAPSTTAPGSATPGSHRCRTADLTVKTGEGGGAAGSRSINLVFGNKSDRACTLFGYPGVSWVAGDNGTQINAPFAREAGESGKKTVTVKPGGVAYSLLIWPYYVNFDRTECEPVEVRGYRVYPPDETAAIFVSSPQTVCSAKGVGTGRVHPVATRAG